MLRTRELEQYVIEAFKVKLNKCELEHYSEGITKVGFYDPKNARKAIYQFATYFRAWCVRRTCFVTTLFPL